MLVNLLGEEFEVDFLDYDFAMKCEEGYNGVIKKSEEITQNANNMKQTEFIIQTCDTINRFFDDVLGAGASERIFKGKKNVLLAYDAFGTFAEAKNRSGQEIINISQKHGVMLGKNNNQPQNRAQRRNNSKNKNKYPNNKRK